MRHHILNSIQDIKGMISWAKENKFTTMAFDLETNGTDESLVYVWGIGICFDEEDAFYIPIRNKHGELLIDEFEAAEYVNDLLKTHNVIGHNIIYDALVWDYNYYYDLTDHITDDTILMKHLVDEEQPFSLKEVAVRYLGPWANKAQTAMIENIKLNGGTATKENMQMFKCDTEILAEYCAWDVLLTMKLYNIFKKSIEEQNLMDLYQTEVMPLYREVTIPMKRKGLHIDKEYFVNLKRDITFEIERLEDAVMTELDPTVSGYSAELLDSKCPVKRTGGFPRALALELGEVLPDSLAKKELKKFEHLTTVQWLLGVDCVSSDKLLNAQLKLYFEKYPDQRYVFNLRSKTHLKHLLFDILKLEPIDTTETGQPKADDDFLDTLEYPWAKLLQDLNKLEKIRGTYIEGILDRQINGVVYTSMLQFGTTSGRYASRNPNMQNLPRPKEEDSGLSELVLKYTNAIRAGFVSPEGYSFVDADYSALEPRCFAEMSSDKNLQHIFHSGEDMYSAIAKRVFDLKDVSTFKKDANFLGKLYPEKRQIIKALALAVTYGAEAFRIADLLKIDKDAAQKLIDDYLKAYPGLKKYISTCHYEANNKGMVRTMLDRVRHLEQAKVLYKSYGHELLNSRWARSHGLSDERREYKNKLNNSTNFKIQGLAAHIVNRAMISIAREFKKNDIDGWVSLQIHDQIVVTVRDNQAEQAREIVKFCMENVIKLSVPLVAEPKIAHNLRDSH